MIKIKNTGLKNYSNQMETSEMDKSCQSFQNPKPVNFCNPVKRPSTTTK